MTIQISFSDKIVRVAVELNGGIESLITELPKRKWVELTEEDIDEIHSEIKAKGMGSYKTEDIYRAIEAKLKERNT
jgi:hypothetical protein